MRTKLIDVGNAKGVRLPESIIKQAGLSGPLEIEVSGDAVVIRSVRQVREGWAAAAAACHHAGDDCLVDWEFT